MRKTFWIHLALLLVIPGLLFTVSCAKKTVQADTDSSVKEMSQDEMAAQEAAAQAKARAEQEELARQRAQEAERAAKEEAMKREVMAARNAFLNDNVYFEFDSDVLLPVAEQVLQRKAAWLKVNSGVTVAIGGHCDERGTNEYNLALGERRAQSAKTYLVDLGVSSIRLSTISYGEERPLDSGHNEEAWAKNRRAQFVIE
ncbi:MAG: peptidoglycan-associated lipoprotein Pal [Desulfobacterales bacterium]|nr:peptidoglycan-associated lipoprotein Pal [Desulfobacterales bacterium]